MPRGKSRFVLLSRTRGRNDTLDLEYISDDLGFLNDAVRDARKDEENKSVEFVIVPCEVRWDEVKEEEWS